MAQKLFLNYRREDSKGEALALRQYLARKLPRIGLFVDMAGGIKPSDNFVRKLDHSVSNADAFVCLIGPQWLTVKTSDGQRRIDEPNDFVRMEIASALRLEVPILAVLLDDASMPNERDLPDDIRLLASKSAVRLRHDRFAADAEDMTSALRPLLVKRASKARSSWVLAGALTAAMASGVIAGGALTYALTGGERTNPSELAARYAKLAEAHGALESTTQAKDKSAETARVALATANNEVIETRNELQATKLELAKARTALDDAVTTPVPLAEPVDVAGGRLVTSTQGRRLATIQQRRTLLCGVNTGLAGFSIPDARGRWSGLDVDICKAVAAAILGDANKVRYIPLSNQQRFSALQQGEIDILSRNTTWTLDRDTRLGARFAAVTFYDGQGFMVSRKSGLKSIRDLGGATVCVQPNTTNESNVGEFFRSSRMQFRPLLIEDIKEISAAFFAGKCTAFTTDMSALAAVLAKDGPNKGQDHVILPEQISKEPLGPAVYEGDEKLFNVVKWVIYALIEAEEYGITQAGARKLSRETLDPNIARILGKAAGMGYALGLGEDWALKAIEAVGNYGEVWERNIKPLNIPRSYNNLWGRDGGLIYAPPIK